MADTNEIIEKLRIILEEVIKQPVPIELLEQDENLIERYHIDSLVALQVIIEIEQEFSVLIDDDEEAIRMLQSPKEALRFIAANQ